jgi:hypothetical protein
MDSVLLQKPRGVRALAEVDRAEAAKPRTANPSAAKLPREVSYGIMGEDEGVAARRPTAARISDCGRRPSTSTVKRSTSCVLQKARQLW